MSEETERAGTETLAEKRIRIKAQKLSAQALLEKASKLGYAAAIKVRKGEVIFRCAKSTGNGIKMVYSELGVTGVTIFGPTAGPEILGDLVCSVVQAGVDAGQQGWEIRK